MGDHESYICSSCPARTYCRSSPFRRAPRRPPMSLIRLLGRALTVTPFRGGAATPTRAPFSVNIGLNCNSNISNISNSSKRSFLGCPGTRPLPHQTLLVSDTQQQQQQQQLRSSSRSWTPRRSRQLHCASALSMSSAASAALPSSQQLQQEPPQPLRVAVVGGGLTGAACAWRITQRGHQAVVFDLGRRATGGRSSTRRTPDLGGLQFDHGTQFFNLQHPELLDLSKELTAAGCVSGWEPRLAEVDCATGLVIIKGEGNSSSTQPGFFDCLVPGSRLLVGNPSSDTICTHLLSLPGVSLQKGTKVSYVAFEAGEKKWRISGIVTPERGAAAAAGVSDLGSFDALVLADILCAKKGSPGFVAAQGEAASDALSGFHSAAAAVSAVPLFSLLLAFDAAAALDLPFEAACFTGGSGVSWLACDSSKPGRPRDGMQCWVAISTDTLARELLGEPAAGSALPVQDAAYLADRAARMLQAIRLDLERAGLKLPEPAYVQAHRWGSAYVAQPLVGEACISDVAVRFAAAGDFCMGAGVESAIASGIAAADAVTGTFTPKM